MTQARQQGATAAYRGLPYSSNPYPRGSETHLAWSQGHNNGRVTPVMMRQR
jgi:hypothetical protein